MRWFSLLPWPLVALLAACSPTYNWREFRLDDAPLVVQLPCKPEHASREVPLGEDTVPLRMTGCRVAGVTFAVGRLRLAPTAPGGQRLAQWRAASLARLRAGEVREQPFQPKGSLGLPQSLRVDTVGQTTEGRPVRASAVWFARLAPDGLWLFHAAVYADAVPASVVDSFFNGLTLQ